MYRQKQTIMETLFRFHRGLLSDSLETTTFVTGLEAIKTYIKESDPLLYYELRNIRIMKEPYVDDRLPKEWGSIEYMVVADFDGYKGQCIGFANFKE